MKQITLFRHGKSSRDDPGLADLDRPLLLKGQKKTEKMALHMLELGMQVDLVVVSPAIRAFQTACIVAAILGVKNHEFITDNNLYHGSTDRIWDVIAALPAEVRHVLLVGHNPGLTEFINESGIARLDWLPTSGMASALFPCEHWHECAITPPTHPLVLWPAKIK